MNDTYDFEWITQTLNNGSLKLISYKGKAKELLVPSEICGNFVTEIGSQLFLGNDQITDVHISEEIVTIDSGAFALCSNVKSVHLPSTLKSIEAEAFSMCSNLQSIFIPQNVSHIGENAFSMCDKLTEIKVDPKNRIFTVKNGILYNKADKIILTCEKSVSGKLTLPEDALEISSYAFAGCSQVMEFLLPSGLAYIGENAFAWCEKLETMFIPDSVKSIDAQAFDSCSSLAAVSVHSSCKFGKESFSPFDKTTKIKIRSLNSPNNVL